MYNVLVYRKGSESPFKLYHPVCVTSGTGGPMPITQVLTNANEAEGHEFRWLRVSEGEAFDALVHGAKSNIIVVADPMNGAPVGLYRVQHVRTDHCEVTGCRAIEM